MSAPAIERRALLRRAGMAALGFGLAGCAARRTPSATWPARPGGGRFARVLVSPERVIRTVVGLRPFRPSGFVLKAERIDDKTVIHDYGHGGGGVTLSWGTAQLAVEEAAATGATRFAVAGCGAVGLATARLLQRRGADVTIYAKDLPPQTTSNVAGAQWSPFSVADAERRTPAFNEQFTRASRISYRTFQDLVGDHYGVRWIENYNLSDEPPRARSPEAELIRDLFPDAKEIAQDDHPFPARYVRRQLTMFIEPGVYLAALTRDFLLGGGRIVVRELHDLKELLTLPEPVVMNCTGLGAKALLGDEELTPIKGQLTVLLPQADVDYIVLANRLYMFPRRDGILLGGTFQRGEWSLEPDEAESRRIMDGHVALFGAMR